MRLSSFIKEQLSEGYDEFVTLYYPGPKKPWEYESERELFIASLRDRINEEAQEARLRRFAIAQTCQERWLREIRKRALPQFRYLTLTEDRTSKRDFMFHLLLADSDWGLWDFNDHLKPLWKQMSGGTAFQKQIDQRLGGFLWNCVMKRGCAVEVSDGRLYCAGMFEEWKPNSP